MKRARLKAFINAIKTIRNTIDDTTALTIPDLYPQWQENKSYQLNDRVLYNDILYKCLQSHTSQPTWNPVNASSLWARVLIPDPEVIPDWIQPDSTNSYMTGDKVKYNGHTYISIIDNNVWAPDIYGWELVE